MYRAGQYSLKVNDLSDKANAGVWSTSVAAEPGDRFRSEAYVLGNDDSPNGNVYFARSETGRLFRYSPSERKIADPEKAILNIHCRR